MNELIQIGLIQRLLDATRCLKHQPRSRRPIGRDDLGSEIIFVDMED